MRSDLWAALRRHDVVADAGTQRERKLCYLRHANHAQRSQGNALNREEGEVQQAVLVYVSADRDPLPPRPLSVDRRRARPNEAF